MFGDRGILKSKARIIVFFGAALFSFFYPLTGAGQLPLNKGVLILSPHFFPGWQAQHVTHPFVVYDGSGEERYRMFYSGSSSTQVNESLWDQWVTGFVTSPDGVHWKYPDNYEQVLFARKLMEGDVVNPEDQAKIFDAVYAKDAFVLKDGNLYKCWYTGWAGDIRHRGGGLSDKVNFRIGYATSSDGVTWEKFKGPAGAGAVLGPGPEHESDGLGVEDPYIIKEHGIYRMWYAGYDGKTRRIHSAISNDGVSWTRQGVALSPGGKRSQDEAGVTNPVVIQRSGKYELWYQGESVVRPNFHLMRAVSADGNQWKKSGEIVLHPETPEPSGPWSEIALSGDEQVIPGSILVQPDNSCVLFYAMQFTGSRKGTYELLRAPLSYLYTERINP